MQPTYERSTLLQTLFAYRDSECSNPLDRVYALRGIASDGPYVRIGYSRSVREAYLQAALAVIFQNPGLVRFRDEGARTLLLPSPPCPVEMLRLFALATCFKTNLLQTDGAGHEAWMPDWRTSAAFASHEHESTVRSILLGHACVPKSLEEDNHLPDAAVIIASGHWYFRAPGRALFRAALAQDSLWATITSTTGFTKIVELRVSTDAAADTFWLPAKPSETELSHNTVVAFPLRLGTTRTAHDGHPVYRLHQCFELRPSSLVAPVVRTMAEAASYWGIDGDRSMDYFYLEWRRPSTAGQEYDGTCCHQEFEAADVYIVRSWYRHHTGITLGVGGNCRQGCKRLTLLYLLGART